MAEYSENFNVAFVSCSQVGSEKELRGAVLVTDKRGHPIELRYTDPVKASTLEKLVYGITLSRGIAIEKIALPLIEALENSFNIIIVKDENLLDLSKSVTVPVCFLSEEEQNSVVSSMRNDEERNQKLNHLLDLNLDENFDRFEPLERLDRVLEHVQFYGKMVD